MTWISGASHTEQGSESDRLVSELRGIEGGGDGGVGDGLRKAEDRGGQRFNGRSESECGSRGDDGC